MQDDDSSGRESYSLAERVTRRLQKNGTGPLKGAGVQSAPPGSPSPSASAPPPPVRPAPVASPADGLAPVPLGLRDDGAQSALVQSPSLHLNYKRLQSLGFTTPDSPRSGNTEEFRVIKRQILKTVFSEGRTRRSGKSNIVMVTSSVPGEGKTFMSLNLALSLTMERDLYVLLVDSDNHRHSLSNLIGIDEGSVGLVDLLIDRSLKLPDIMRRTDLPNLTIIPAGTAHHQGAELLSSKEMGKLMGDLATRYPDRIIIIDTPPVLASTEGVVLSAHVGHAVVVVQKDRTAKRQLHRTLDMLGECENLSCILNMDTAEQRFSEYAYGY